jgi:hypothetical protein
MKRILILVAALVLTACGANDNVPDGYTVYTTSRYVSVVTAADGSTPNAGWRIMNPSDGTLWINYNGWYGQGTKDTERADFDHIADVEIGRWYVFARHSPTIYVQRMSSNTIQYAIPDNWISWMDSASWATSEAIPRTPEPAYPADWPTEFQNPQDK